MQVNKWERNKVKRKDETVYIYTCIWWIALASSINIHSMFYSTIKCISHTYMECLVQTALLMACFLIHTVVRNTWGKSWYHVHAMCDNSYYKVLRPWWIQIGDGYINKFNIAPLRNLIIPVIILGKFNRVALTAKFTRASHNLWDWWTLYTINNTTDTRTHTTHTHTKHFNVKCSRQTC